MDRTKYYLLYVLSEPAVSVPKTASHKWKKGDVLLAQAEAASISERFLILDMNHDGQFMALQLKDEPKKDEPAIHCFYLRPDELEGSAPDYALRIAFNNYANCYQASQWVCLNKIYFEQHITSKEACARTLQLGGHFSALSL